MQAAEAASASRATGPRRTARSGGGGRPGLSWASAAGTAIRSLGSDHFSEGPLTLPCGRKRGVRLQEREGGKSQGPAESSPPLGAGGGEVGGGACVRLTWSCETLGRRLRPPPTGARSRAPSSSFSCWRRLAGRKEPSLGAGGAAQLRAEEEAAAEPGRHPPTPERSPLGRAEQVA